jgi:hypothetical protein
MFHHTRCIERQFVDEVQPAQANETLELPTGGEA